MIWRIRERSVFARLSRDGLRTRAGVLWCTFLPDPSASPPRVAFAIGRAVGPAVVRNQVRRRLRALLAALPPTSTLPSGWYLIGARPDAAGSTSTELQRDLDALVRSVVRRAAAPSAATSAATSARRPDAVPPA
ncbi:MAG: ribonuclease P protein component [Acidimicrobiales bacterium]|nr:ribonuclease P protein component [Acidimicrobiales bacterium]MCB9392950.1 ribonuclease P protein component [Acidimicrobiaceae bacterium]